MNTEENQRLSEWGLPLEAIAGLSERLIGFHKRYREYMRTKTGDTSEYGLAYLSGLLRMECDRTIANIGRVGEVAEQNRQQFISDSPWSGSNLIAGVQAEIRLRPEYQQGTVLLLDESADAKSGETTIGVGRQHNGRLGKIDECQVGVFAAVANNGYATWADGELFLPESWFSAANAAKRQRLGVPPARSFATKPELALRVMDRLQANDVPFEAVDCDSLYGRKGWLRDQLTQRQIEYYADVPENTRIYWARPLVFFPTTKRRQPAKRPQVLGVSALVKELIDHSKTEWHTFVLRSSERGQLVADFARHPIWTVDPDGTCRQEWLLIRRDAGQITYSLSNAPGTASLLTMAERKSQRFWIERANQNAKSELGWDELQAIKYRAWQHHLAFTILASWFVTETRLDWAQQFPRDPSYFNSIKPMSCPNSRSPTCVPYSAQRCLSLSYRLNKPPNWLSNISIISPVRDYLGSQPLVLLEI